MPRRGVLARIVLAVLIAACGEESPPIGSAEALDERYPDVRQETLASTQLEQARLDATVVVERTGRAYSADGVFLQGHCGGVLISPRVVATASHCASPSLVVRLVSQYDGTSASAPSIGVQRCLLHPDARTDGRPATCDDPPDIVHLPSGRDLALLVLDRRLDLLHGAVSEPPVVPARPQFLDPTRVVDGLAQFDPSGGAPRPELWPFVQVRLSSGRNLGFFGGRSGFRDFILTYPAGVSADGVCGPSVPVDLGDAGGPADANIDAGLDAGSPPNQITPFQDGDSGSPMLLRWDVADEVTALGVVRGSNGYDQDCGGEYYTRFSAPAVRGWVEPLLAAGVGRIYLGGADRQTRCRGHDDPPFCLAVRTPADDALDPDGDGLDDDTTSPTHDNCRGTYNPSQLDGDHDGLGDECDTCPNRPSSGLDSDEDGLGDECDDCPFVANQEQLDTDLGGPDGVGDACDDCPGDYDPRSTNGHQPNCNLDAELAAGACDPETSLCARGVARVVGDACDPVPCGLTDVRTSPVGDPQTTPTLRTTSLVVDGRVARAFDSRRRGSTGFRFCPCEVAAGDSIEDRQACADPRLNPAPCAPNAIATYTASTQAGFGPVDDRAWRWITTNDDATPASDPIMVARYGPSYEPVPPGTGDVLGPDLSVTHCLRGTEDPVHCAVTRCTGAPGGCNTRTVSDVDRWLADLSLSTSFPVSTTDALHLRGVLWTRTTSLGAPRPGPASGERVCDDGVDDDGGGAIDCADRDCVDSLPCVAEQLGGSCSTIPCPDPQPFDASLASHYWSGLIPATTTVVIPGTAPPPWLSVIGPLLGDAACPYCAGFFPEIQIAWPGIGVDPTYTNANFGAVALAIGGFRVPLESFGLKVLSADTFAGAGRRWAFAAEPTGWLEPVGARAISLDASTNAVVSATIATTAGLLAVDLTGCGKIGCTGFAAGGATTPTSLAAQRGEPPVRAGAAYVLSAGRGTTFVVGGDRGEHPASAIDTFSFLGGWSSLPEPSIPLGTVLAATYSPEEDALYVLDEATDRHAAHARLLRIDPDDASVVEVGRWTRITPHARYAITAGADRRVYIAVSTGPHAHLVASFDREGHPRGVVAGRGALTSAPIHASPRGITVVVLGEHGPEPIGHEWPTLATEPHIVERLF